MTKGNPSLFVCVSYSARPSLECSITQLGDDLWLLCFADYLHSTEAAWKVCSQVP